MRRVEYPFLVYFKSNRACFSLQGRVGLGQLYFDPTLVAHRATTEHLGEAKKQGTWQRLCAAGMRPASCAAFLELLELLGPIPAPRVLAALFTFVGGVIVTPEPKFVPVNGPVPALTIPDEYKVSNKPSLKESKNLKLFLTATHVFIFRKDFK